MAKPLNGKKGNAPFEQKRLAYDKSDLFFTKMIAQNRTWGRAEIDARSEALAERAVETWPLKFW